MNISKMPTWTFGKVLIICAFSLIIVSCEKQDTEVFPLEPENQKSKAETLDEPVTLVGKSYYDVYSILNKDYVGNPPEAFYLDVEAVLSQVDKHQYTLVVNELMNGWLIRTTTFDVKISSGGSVNFHWPDQVDDIFAHTGYDLHGPGINKGGLDFKGTFKGNKFYAETRNMAQQVQPGTVELPGVIDYTKVVEGPILFKISFDLEVD